MKSFVILGVCALGAILIGGYAIISEDGLTQTRKLADERDALKKQISHIENENGELAHQIESLRDEKDPAKHKFLESVVREELGYVKDDEIVVITKH